MIRDIEWRPMQSPSTEEIVGGFLNVSITQGERSVHFVYLDRKAERLVKKVVHTSRHKSNDWWYTPTTEK